MSDTVRFLKEWAMTPAVTFELDEEARKEVAEAIEQLHVVCEKHQAPVLIYVEVAAKEKQRHGKIVSAYWETGKMSAELAMSSTLLSDGLLSAHSIYAAIIGAATERAVREEIETENATKVKGDEQ